VTLAVLEPGLLSTVQDLGRFGHRRHGVVAGGAMDRRSHAVANILVGNDPGAATIEMTLMGAVLRFEAEALVALAGGGMRGTIGGEAVPLRRPVLVPKGAELRFSPTNIGCRAYLAVAGGLAVLPVLGSRSTYLRAGLGGHHGRALRADDRLPVGAPTALGGRLARLLAAERGDRPFATTAWCAAADLDPSLRQSPHVRVLPGLQATAFDHDSLAAFHGERYTVSPRSDRMGYRLDGPALRLSQPRDLLSEAVATGTVQVPPEGKPIVLMADAQTTGGYPRIAQVIEADLPVLGQLRPGDVLRFVPVGLAEAEERRRQAQLDLRRLAAGVAVHAGL
jgi:antagonist of KipI